MDDFEKGTSIYSGLAITCIYLRQKAGKATSLDNLKQYFQHTKIDDDGDFLEQLISQLITSDIIHEHAAYFYINKPIFDIIDKGRFT